MNEDALMLLNYFITFRSSALFRNVKKLIQIGYFVASPSMPTNVQVRRTSPTSMEVTWDPPTSTIGAIAGYRVYYSMLALPADMEQWQSMEIGPYTVVEISGLETHTSYAVRVRSKSSDNRLSNFSEIAFTNKLENSE